MSAGRHNFLHCCHNVNSGRDSSNLEHRSEKTFAADWARAKLTMTSQARPVGVGLYQSVLGFKLVVPVTSYSLPFVLVCTGLYKSLPDEHVQGLGLIVSHVEDFRWTSEIVESALASWGSGGAVGSFAPLLQNSVLFVASPGLIHL